MQGTRVLQAARQVGPRVMNAFRTEAVTAKALRPSPVSWGSKKNKVLTGIATAALVGGTASAMIYNHEKNAGPHTPTASSTVGVATDIAYEASFGIAGGMMDSVAGQDITNEIGLGTQAQTQKVSHDQRQRMAKLEGARHVVGVNAVCDTHGIPLSATIADLFILHHEVNPEIGSPLDSAFEQLIIEKFREEFNEGMSVENAEIGVDRNLDQFSVETNQRKLNSVSAVGVGAHSSFQGLKEFLHKFKEALKDPTRAKRAMYSPDVKDYSEEYETALDTHKAHITQALTDVRSTIRDHRDAGVYSRHTEDENNERDNLIKEQAKTFMAAPKENVAPVTEQKAASNMAKTMSFKERMQAGRAAASPTETQDKKQDDTYDEGQVILPKNK